MPARLVEVLCDGSVVVELAESDAMLSRRRKTSGECGLPRLRPVLARLVEFTVTSRDRSGRTTISRYRVLTTLLDHRRCSAPKIAELYAERWQIEHSRPPRPVVTPATITRPPLP